MNCHRAAIILGALSLLIFAGSIASVPADDGNSSPQIAQTPYQAPGAAPRYTAFISDLHFGVGKETGGAWDPTEDFRWPRALEGFLNKITEEGQQGVDLVIVGDFLEMWQPPPEIKCSGVSADLGCSVDEMASLVQKIVTEHSGDLEILRVFAERGENRLHIILGNHDSALRYEPIWKPLGIALNARGGRINLLTDEVWVSSDGRMVAEHGHQIGQDVNKYATWPSISRRVDGKDYIVRPWGGIICSANVQRPRENLSDHRQSEPGDSRRTISRCGPRPLGFGRRHRENAGIQFVGNVAETEIGDAREATRRQS